MQAKNKYSSNPHQPLLLYVFYKTKKTKERDLKLAGMGEEGLGLFCSFYQSSKVKTIYKNLFMLRFTNRFNNKLMLYVFHTVSTYILSMIRQRAVATVFCMNLMSRVHLRSLKMILIIFLSESFPE